MNNLLSWAQSALDQWPHQYHGGLILLQAKPAAVYEVRGSCGLHYLRLSPTSWRSPAAVDCELAFIKHLSQLGCRVAKPILTETGDHKLEINNWTGVLFEAAPGEWIDPASADWAPAMFRNWGTALACQHQAARDFEPPLPSWRDDWQEEPVFVKGLSLLNQYDPEAADLAARVLNALAKNSDCLGPKGYIHADLAPQNFRFSPKHGLTAFDFDNCTRHFLAYDLAVARLVLSRKNKAAQTFRWICEGYTDHVPLPCDVSAMASLMSLRALYTLCDRIVAANHQDEVSMNALRSSRKRFLATTSLSQ